MAIFDRERSEVTLPMLEKEISDIDNSYIDIDTRAKDGTRDGDLLKAIDDLSLNVIDAKRKKIDAKGLFQKLLEKISEVITAPFVRLNWNGTATGIDAYAHYRVRDTADDVVGNFSVARRSTEIGNHVQAYIYATNPIPNESNYLGVYVLDDGSLGYNVASPSKFRETIGANNATNITEGTLGAARLPNHSASLLTYGTLGGARLPNIFKTITASSSTFSVNANTGYSANISISVPSGYTAVGVIGITTTHEQAGSVGGFNLTSQSNVNVQGKNTGTSSWNDMKVTVTVLCVLSNTI